MCDLKRASQSYWEAQMVAPSLGITGFHKVTFLGLIKVEFWWMLLVIIFLMLRTRELDPFPSLPKCSSPLVVFKQHLPAINRDSLGL